MLATSKGRWARVLALAALPMLMAGTARAAEPVKIPVILPLTGGAAFLGSNEWVAMQAAEKTFNAHGGIHGRPAEFDIHDDQSSPQLALQLAGAAIATGAPIVIGSTLVSLCNAMSPLFRNGPVEYCVSPAIHPKPGGYIFSGSVNFDDLVTTSIRFLDELHLTRLGAIYSIDASGQDIEKANDAAMKLPENHDMTMVAVAHYNPTDVSVSAQMERIKEANPQAFLAWSPGAQVATLFKGQEDAGLHVPTVTTPANMTYAQMHQYAGFLPKVLYLPATEWVHAAPGVTFDPRVAAAHRSFYDAFAKLGKKPDEPLVDGWEVASLVLHVLATLPENPSATQVRNAIAHTTDYAGVNGIYNFEETPQRGLSAKYVVMTRWDPDRQEFVMVSQPGTGKPLETAK